jgi:hypothetical protein
LTTDSSPHPSHQAFHLSISAIVGIVIVSVIFTFVASLIFYVHRAGKFPFFPKPKRPEAAELATQAPAGELATDGTEKKLVASELATLAPRQELATSGTWNKLVSGELPGDAPAVYELA